MASELAGLLTGAQEGLPGLALVGARLLPLVWLVPFFGGRTLPALPRTGLWIALTIGLAPMAPVAAAAPPAGLALLPLVGLELLRGAVAGVALALPFHAFEWAGRLVDLWRGSSLGAELVDPTTGESASPLGVFYRLLAVAAFVVVGGHRAALRALGEGLRRSPPGTTVGAEPGLGAVVDGVGRLFADALALTLAVAAPAAVALLLAEVVLGLVGRAAPQLPVFFAGMPLRAAAALAALALSLSLALRALGETVAAALLVIAGG